MGKLKNKLSEMAPADEKPWIGPTPWDLEKKCVRQARKLIWRTSPEGAAGNDR